MTQPFVAILMGSDSDLPVMESTIDTLKSLGVRCEVKISSAHRTPEATRNYVEDADQRLPRLPTGKPDRRELLRRARGTRR